MKVKNMNEYFREKDTVDLTLLKEIGINLCGRDIIEEYDEKKGENIYKLNFTGFEIDNQGNVIYFFPYEYRTDSLEKDGELLFKTIYRHIQKRPELYFGQRADKDFRSNYPFESFFEVFNYYLENGLYIEYFDRVTNRHTGKVNWKHTISKSDKYIINDMIFFPTPYYKNILGKTNFLTDCMSFVLEYTISKFNFIFGIKTLGLNYNNLNFLENKEFVKRTLMNLNTKIFNSKTKKLLNSIVRFFEEIKEGGNFYLKHYNFESIWEDMVQEYLNDKFRGYIGCSIDLGGSNEQNKFKKEVFFPNLINLNHNIQPDNVLKKNNNIYIFDAKYYIPTGIDYKQICYSLFLSSNIDGLKNLYSALIIPGKNRKTKEYFLMNPKLNSDLINLKISLEYLDIRNVMEAWI